MKRLGRNQEGYRGPIIEPDALIRFMAAEALQHGWALQALEAAPDDAVGPSARARPNTVTKTITTRRRFR